MYQNDRIWDIASLKCVAVYDDHSEFVVGVDFNNHVPGLLADCAWDERVVFRQLPVQ